MHLSPGHLFVALALLNLALGSPNASLTNFDDAEDLILMSSWQSIKYWSTNSTLHSSRVLEDLVTSESNSSNSKRISGLELYGKGECNNVLVWCELNSQTLYSAQIDTNGRSLSSREPTKLLQMNFGSHVRLAVDSAANQIYLCLYDLSRIDVFDVETRTLKTFISNTSHPNDIVFDSQRRILFWIENWSCVYQRSVNDTDSPASLKSVKVCSNNVRALAVDPPNDLLFWSDTNGNIYQQKYMESNAQIIFSARKMQRNLAIGVTRNAIYLSDEFKLMAIERTTLKERVVLVESDAILDFKCISCKDLCNGPQAQVEAEARVTEQAMDNFFNYSVIDKTSVTSIVITQSPINTSLTVGSKSDNSKDIYNFSSIYISIICLSSVVLICLIAMSVIMTLRHLSKRSHKQSPINTTIKRINARKDSKFLSDKHRLIQPNDSNVGKTVCIEDLGSFNSSWLDPSVGANRALRQACSSCEDRDECMERGICLTTYRLLT